MKLLKKLAIVLLIIGGLFYFFGLPYMQKENKKHSPKTTAAYTYKESELSVVYSSPSKKDRVIFGELVPYDKVWRTGANEPTTFTNSQDIKIIDKLLPAGTYSLWTIPNKNSWKIIFNKEVPGWGTTMFSRGKETARDPEQDAVVVEVPVRELMQPVENFTIAFEENNPPYLTLSWDKVKVNVPINK